MRLPSDVGMDLADLVVEEMLPYDEVGKRIIANRLLEALSGWMPRAADRPGEVIPFSDGEARDFGQMVRMEFGRYEGKRVDEVPMDYLVWLCDTSRTFWRQVHRYLNSPRIGREREQEGI